MKRKKYTVLLIVVMILVLVLAGEGYRALTNRKGAVEAPAAQQSQTQTVMLPDFTVQDGNGNSVNSADFQGKPTVINFWATWCGYCVEEMADFETAYQAYGDKINFVMLNATDGERETKKVADAFVAEHGFTFPVYYDLGYDAVQACGVTGFPVTLFVSPEGEIVNGKVGQIQPDALDQALKELLA